jgi:hypothetical protein
VNILEEQSQRRNTLSASPAIILIIGDALVMLLFAWVGRRSHSMSILDIRALLTAVAPFIVAWFLVTPWFGLFKADVSQHWRKLLPRLLVAWAIGGPLALVLRALFLGRAIPGGIIPSFAVVALGFTTLFMLTWRLGYIWWVSRRRSQTEKAGGATR